MYINQYDFADYQYTQDGKGINIIGNDDKAPIVANKVQSIMPTYQGEFGEVVSGVSIDGLMQILSEHMEVIKLLYPKEYQAVLQRIREIQ